MSMYSKKVGTGDPIVVLHGWGFHSDIMQPLVKHLATHHEVIAMDLPGFGRSTLCDGEYNLNNVIQSILEVSPLCATYMGWSLGGLLAMKIALQYPERVNKLITIAATPYFIKQNNWPGVDAKVFAEFVDGVMHNTEFTLQKFALSVVHSKFPKEQLFMHGVPSLGALLGGLNILESTDMREHLRDISCPKQFIFAEKDNLIPVEVAQKIKLLAPEAEVSVIPGAGHTPFFANYVTKISPEG